MSHYDYIVGRDIYLQDPPFYALIQAAMRKADSTNQFKLKHAWPEVYAELEQRYNAPDGLLAGETIG